MIKKIKDIAFGLNQMPVKPGQPRVNADYIINQIREAEEKKIEILIFPEMCISGYLVGDIFEDEYFCTDVMHQNERIREATRHRNIIVIFGSLFQSSIEVGEDGRRRLYNTAFVAQNGKWIGNHAKYLLVNYRYFNDSRHFYSGRKLNNYQGLDYEYISSLRPVKVKTKSGSIKIGLMVCEDMWDVDYKESPAKILVNKGAELLINISASPWGWKKNEKRHRVAKNLLEKRKIPLIYVNNTGVQNNGKNIITFDGSSTVYDDTGEILFSIPPNNSGTYFFQVNKKQNLLIEEMSDTKALYLALKFGLKAVISNLPMKNPKVIIGLSGGIDSATDASLLVDVVGKENVYAYNMPSQYNSEATKNLAKTIAENLGIQYEVIPIQESVDVMAKLTGCEAGTLAYENIQARMRMEILAAKAQLLGGVFISNSNKDEIFFGYGTLYGDLAGFCLPLGDLVKREVYQLADYLNREVHHKMVIPAECFDIVPSAELSMNQKDPFDYGNLKRRGYHDELVRAIIEFRKNAEWFLQAYADGSLESELKLEAGTLQRLFPSALAFINDLKKCWNLFFNSYFKRVQSLPIIVVSKRAFGNDLLESIFKAYYTDEFYALEKAILSNVKESIAIFGGSFNPPTQAHVAITEQLVKQFNRVIIVTRGEGIQPYKVGLSIISPAQRKKIVQLAFEKIPGLEYDFDDLDNEVYTSTYELKKKYSNLYGNSSISIVVGSDLVVPDERGKSPIQKSWDHGEEVWYNSNFVVVPRKGYEITKENLPPLYQLISGSAIEVCSTTVRKKISRGQNINGLVPPAVYEAIKNEKMYF